MATIYSNFFETKTKSIIPLLKNGKSIESKYNPEREADSLILQIKKKFDFFIVVGLGSGIFIKKVSQNFPSAKIIGIEFYQNDIDFLSQIETFNDCKKNKNIIISDFDNLQKTILNNYIPSIFGDAKIIFQRIWSYENQNEYQKIKNEIQKSLTLISEDYSVQSHFGKLWQKNIIENLFVLSKLKKKEKIIADTKKTAIIVAAGPSLDKKIDFIKQNLNNFYIISTDTAYETLSKNKIISDIVVSIDGQNISTNHFYNNLDFSKTNFVFDLCANSCVSKKLKKSTNKIFFFSNGHPLSEYAKNFSNQIFSIFTGSGTVTIAALDLAIKLSFNKILIFGADFSYINGKTYTKGTYLDNLYNKNSNYLFSTEKYFSKLMFRTELKKINKKYTTTTLENYKISMENYLNQRKINFIKSDDVYEIHSNEKSLFFIKNDDFNFSDFIKNLTQISTDSPNFKVFLPFIAYLRTKNEYKNLNFEELIKETSKKFSF